MAGPRSYVVRIYRQGFRSLAGVIEDTATTTACKFRDEEELLAILRGFCPDKSSLSEQKPSSRKHGRRQI